MTSIPTATPVCLGLDPSPLRLGYAVCNWDLGTPMWNGCLDINRADAGWVEAQISQQMGRLNYSLTINHPEYAIAAIAVESMFIGPSKGDSINLADNAGIVCGIASQMWQNVPIYRFRPSEWRKANGLKGNATKEECYDHAELVGYLLPERKRNGQDAADAGLIALAAYRRYAPATLARVEGAAA